MGARILTCVLGCALAATGTARADVARIEAPDVSARIAAARAATSSGRVADLVRAAAIFDGVVPTNGDPRLPVQTLQLPVAIAGPVSRLASAVDWAGGEATSALRDSAAEIRRADQALKGSLRRPHEDPTLPAGWDVDALVDRVRLHGAALTLSNEVDAAIHALRSVPAVAAGGDRNTGCDVLDLAPALCVGGEGPNVYEKDVALQIDLGGNDIYRNSAGGADLDRNGLAVSVAIDLAGDDRYEAVLPTPSGSTVAQGAVALGGIGILVDASGDDEYSVTGRGVAATGQGSAVAGVGVLADLGGDDGYVLGEDRTPSAPDVAQGLGVASTGALAAAVDVGGGDDTYLVQARLLLGRDDLGTLYPGSPMTFGFGVAGAASALFADDGGADTMQLRSANAAVPADHEGYVLSTIASVTGYGAASFAASAIALGGPGDTTWGMDARAEAQGVTGVGGTGFGFGSADGVGILSDGGGDDRYLLEAEAYARAERTIDDTCACSGLEVFSTSSGVSGIGFGAGFDRGLGALVDAGGDDVYDVRIGSRSEATAIDRRTKPFPRGDDGDPIDVRADAYSTDIVVWVQGVGTGRGPDLHRNRLYNHGAGLLRDDEGSDRYAVDAHQDVRATATSDLGEWVTNASARTMGTTVLAQGAAMLGSGTLDDRAGVDSYEVSRTSVQSAQPQTEASERTSLWAAQGDVIDMGTGVLSDVDGGLLDTFTATAPHDPCIGKRGEAIWRSCAGAGTGLGVNQ